MPFPVPAGGGHPLMAVYTEVSPRALERFLAGYALGAPTRFQGIAEGVENSNFLLSTEAGDFVLTLFEKRVDPAELPWFVGLMRHLARHGVSCPLPVEGRDGAALRELAGRPAVICTFLPGRGSPPLDPPHCAALGTALAGLHHAGAGFAGERPNGLGPDAWGPLLRRCRDTGADPALCAELEERLIGILDAWPAPGALPRGHIHADLFPDNVFFEDGRISGLIDFYFACTDLLAYDLAICLNAWCFDEALRFHPGRARALVAAHDAVRPLTGAEREALPVLCRGAALRFLLTRLYDWTNTPPGALVTRKDPMQYLARLRAFSEEAADVLAA